jgi:hypothetical protein
MDYETSYSKLQRRLRWKRALYYSMIMTGYLMLLVAITDTIVKILLASHHAT